MSPPLSTFALSVIALVLGLCGPVWGCTARTNIVPSTDASAAELLARGQPASFDVRIEVTTDQPGCKYLLGFETLVSTPALQVSLQRKPFGQPLLDLPQAEASQLLQANPIGIETLSLSVALKLFPRQRVDAGHYRIPVVVRTYEGGDSVLARLSSQAQQQLAFQVPALVDVWVESTTGRNALGGQSGLIDFGELRPGARAGAKLLISANAPVSIEIDAGLELVHSGRPEYRIPYALQLDGGAVVAGTAFDLSLDGQNDTAVALDAVVGDIERVAAGEYRDTVNITIRAE